MCTLNFVKYYIIYISYYTLLYYTRRREPPNVLLTYRGVGNKHLMLGQPSGPESRAYDVTSGFFQLIIYKGSKRYFVTGNAKTLVGDRMAPGK